MRIDAFSKRHPLVNFIFFLGAMGCGVVIQHPAYLAVGLTCAGVYYLLLVGRRGWKMLLGLMPLFALITLINPLFNTYGATVLTRVFGRPYTLEGLYYGAAVAGILVGMLIWFGCYNQVLTSDKFTSLFGNMLPALSLLLVMVLRLIPNLIRKTRQILGARKSIGKGADDDATTREKLDHGMRVLSALTDWALEGSVVTGDAMRSRGYGAARRSSFMIYRMTGTDVALLIILLALLGTVIISCVLGCAEATFTPQLYIAPVSGWRAASLLAYTGYLLIPTILHCKEALQWYISRSRI